MIRNIFVFVALFLFLHELYSQNVAINSTGAAPAQSAILDLQSTTAGFLIPRMTADQRDAIASPETGLMVYVYDDNNFYYYNGTAWERFSGLDADWSVKDDTIIYRIDGRVAIGTQNPIHKFEVFTTPAAYGALFSFNNHVFSLKGVNDPEAYLYHLPYIEWRMHDDTRAMYLGWGYTGNLYDKYVDLYLENGFNLAIRGGKVGIGTEFPQKELEVKGTIRITSNSAYKAEISNTDLTMGNSLLKFPMAKNDFFAFQGTDNGDDVGVFYIMTGDNANEPIIFAQKYYSGSLYERMRIHSNGYVGIGDNNPTYRLELPNTSGYGGTGRAYAWIKYADKRTKADIKDINYGLETILKIKPRAYTDFSSHFEGNNLVLENNNTQTLGFIAQELYNIIPEVVEKPDNDSTLWSIDYDLIIPVLVKAIQEQQEIIEKQQAEIENLKKALNISN